MTVWRVWFHRVFVEDCVSPEAATRFVNDLLDTAPEFSDCTADDFTIEPAIVRSDAP